MQVPEACPYEDINVTLKVIDTVDGHSTVLGPISITTCAVSHRIVVNLNVSCDSTYNVSLTIENQVNERITIQTTHGICKLL